MWYVLSDLVASKKWRAWIRVHRHHKERNLPWVRDNPDGIRLVLEVFMLTAPDALLILEELGSIENMLKLDKEEVLYRVHKAIVVRKEPLHTLESILACFEIWLDNQHAWIKKQKKKAKRSRLKDRHGKGS